MKKIVVSVFFIGLLLLTLSGCTTPSKQEPAPVPERMTMPEKPLIQSFSINDINIDHEVINPVKGEKVAISYSLSKPAKSIVKIFDGNMNLVRELISNNSGNPERNTVFWDGMNQQGNIVPDEAYFITVEAMDYKGNLIYYDPVTISGGEFYIPENVKFDKDKGVITYELQVDARVKIMAGISGGPLLKNILRWAPRHSGLHEEPWDGKETAGNIEVTGLEGLYVLAEAISLPENSIYTKGNTKYDQFTYENEIAMDMPHKRKRPLFQNERTLLGRQSGVLGKRGPEPKFRIELPQSIERTGNGLTIVNGKIPMKIYIDEKVKKYTTEQRYEIIFYVDFKFVTEAEEGHSPFTLFWDTEGISNGEHIITVVVATFNSQISSSSMKVMVQN